MSSVPVDPTRLAVRMAALAASRARVIIGLCGAPGAGKSTLAALLASELNRDVPTMASVVPMDGFHLAKSVIAVDDRATRRGAPDTFDPDGYAALLERLRDPGTDVVYAPEYRRELEDPVAGAIAVPRACPIVVTEGNYLLHPDPAWRRVRDQLDEVWFVEAPSEELRVRRLIERHERFGKSPADARAWALGPDERNAQLIEATATRADRVVELR